MCISQCGSNIAMPKDSLDYPYVAPLGYHERRGRMPTKDMKATTFFDSSIYLVASKHVVKILAIPSASMIREEQWFATFFDD